MSVSLEGLKVPAWFFGIAALLFVGLLVFSAISGQQLSWSPFGFKATNQVISGRSVFSPNKINCGTVDRPCVIKFDTPFEKAPNCVVSPWRNDNTSYSENVMIKALTPSEIRIWRGLAITGTTISVNWICHADSSS